MVFDEKDIENEIKLRQIMLKYNQDNIVNHAYMLYHLYKTYEKYKLKIPNELVKYINFHIEKMNKELPNKLEKLKIELQNKKNKFENKYKKQNNEDSNEINTKIEEKNKKDSLFPEGYFSR